MHEIVTIKKYVEFIHNEGSKYEFEDMMMMVFMFISMNVKKMGIAHSIKFYWMMKKNGVSYVKNILLFINFQKSTTKLWT